VSSRVGYVGEPRCGERMTARVWASTSLGVLLLGLAVADS
jgi:hypothetical protein